MPIKRKTRRFKKQYLRLTCIQKFESNWRTFLLRTRATK